MNIEYKIIESSDIDFLEPLCNSLMTFQADLATIRKDVMASMNFNNRLKPEYESTERKHMVVAYDGNVPIGFAFATITDVLTEHLTMKPSWAEDLSGLSFYPENYTAPKKIGTFKLLYVDEQYRGYQVGKKLSNMLMNWFDENHDIDDLWVYVANGNEVVGTFYEKLGFDYSHSVFNGFVDAYMKKVR